MLRVFVTRPSKGARCPGPEDLGPLPPLPWVTNTPPPPTSPCGSATVDGPPGRDASSVASSGTGRNDSGKSSPPSSLARGSAAPDNNANVERTPATMLAEVTFGRASEDARASCGFARSACCPSFARSSGAVSSSPVLMPPRSANESPPSSLLPPVRCSPTRSCPCARGK